MAAAPNEPAAPGARVLDLWRRLSRLPAGRWLFHRALFRMVPYSGSTGARVVTLEPGRVEIVLRDRRAVRNHLRSIHAVALANVGELASGLAVLTALPPGIRGIVVRLEIEYFRKARGTVRAVSEPGVPDVRETVEHPATAEVRDGDGELVARTTTVWRLAPREAE